MLFVVSRGTAEQNRAKVGADAAPPVLLQQDREVAAVYSAHGTPAAVVVQPDGSVGSALALGADSIRRLVARTAGTPVPLPARQPPPERAALRLGELAPAVDLLDLEGIPIRLEEFRGRLVALLFWNPGCSFCIQMLPDLLRWV
jgi:hypothetical protein